MSRSQRSQLSFAAAAHPLFHSAASRQLARASESSPTPSSSSSAAGHSSHELPEGDYSITGVPFVVDFEHVSRREGRLRAARLSYKVRHKSQLKGKRALAAIWEYGVELDYLEDDLITHSKLWLCRQCHLSRQPNDAKMVNGTAHIVEHLKKVHKIDPATGLLPMTPVRPSSPWEVATGVARSASMGSHVPWQEEELQNAFIDWVIVKDVSFNVAISAETRGILTFNRLPLLAALPSSVTTMSQYVHTSLKERLEEVTMMLKAAPGKLSVSVDVWTSSNYLSFLGVVAHFVGKFFEVSGFPALGVRKRQLYTLASAPVG